MYKIIFLSLIIFVLLIKVEFRILNKEHKTVALIRVMYFIDINIDYFKVIQNFMTTKYNRDKISLREIYENTIILKETYPLINKYSRHCILKKLNIVNRFNDENPYLAVVNYTMFAYISSYVHQNFGKVKRENYYVSNEGELDLDFTCIFHIRMVNIITVSIENFKEVFRLIKKIT